MLGSFRCCEEIPDGNIYIYIYIYIEILTHCLLVSSFGESFEQSIAKDPFVSFMRVFCRSNVVLSRDVTKSLDGLFSMRYIITLEKLNGPPCSFISRVENFVLGFYLKIQFISFISKEGYTAWPSWQNMGRIAFRSSKLWGENSVLTHRRFK